MNEEAKKILSIIETVKPDDKATLDEIDARTHWYIDNSGLWWAKTIEEYIESVKARKCSLPNQYTRSRDALKEIRPKGMIVIIHQYGDGDTFCQFCLDEHTEYPETNKEYKERTSQNLPTEELAELYAIIQAISHDRKKDE